VNEALTRAIAKSIGLDWATRGSDRLEGHGRDTSFVTST